MPGGDFHPWLFVILAAWIIVCGLGVVVFKKIMYSAVSMVFCFLGVAFAYALLNAPLPGPGLNGETADWTLVSYAYLGLVDGFVELDPDFTPPPGG